MASEKITAIIDSVKELSVLELKELIDAYCEEFGVSAVAAAAPAAAGAAAVRYPLPRAAHAGLFGVLCSDVLESVTDLSGVVGSDHHTAGCALRVLIPPSYAHPVHSRASCGLSILPHHADGAEGRRQIHEKPGADRGGYYEKRAGTRDHIVAAVCAIVTASYFVLERSMA